MPFYDNFSAQKSTSLGSYLATHESAGLLRTIIQKNAEISSVLELGSGHGHFAMQCIARRLDYTCVDVSQTMLKKLNADKKILARVPILPFTDDVFDLTFAANLLEHMPDFNSALLLVEEMCRVTRAGGLVCHRVPNAMAWGLHFWNGDYTHSFFTTPRTVHQLYIDAGLKVESVVPVAGHTVGPLAWLMATIGKIIPSWLVGHGANPTQRLSKIIYSTKTSFLLGFLVIGKKYDIL